MKLRNKFNTTLFFALIILSAHAQDPELSQYYSSPLYTNPAFAGLSGGNRVALNYRNQWQGAFNSYAAAFDANLPRINSGLGVLVFSDQIGQGVIQTNSALLSYAFHTKINYDWTMSFGMQAGIQQRQVDWNKLIFADALNPINGAIGASKEKAPGNSTVLYPDFNTGAIAYSDNAFVGLAVHNLNRPNNSFNGYNGDGSRLGTRITLHGGTVLKPNPKIKDLLISPNILLMVQNRFTQLNLGFYISKHNFLTGIWCRQTAHNGDALIAMIGFKKNNFKFCYSYDFTISSQQFYNPGSHEVSLIWVFFKGDRYGQKDFSKISCYGFR